MDDGLIGYDSRTHSLDRLFFVRFFQHLFLFLLFFTYFFCWTVLKPNLVIYLPS